MTHWYLAGCSIGWVAKPSALPSPVCFTHYVWSTYRPVLVLGPGEKLEEDPASWTPQDLGNDSENT